MRLPTWDEINKQEDQRDVLEYPLDQPLFVVGPPGSGKTVLALHRAEMIADSGQVRIITLNRMLRRLLKLLADGRRSVWTMHQYVWRDYQRRTGEEPPQHSEYQNDWEAMLARIKDNRKHHDRFHMVVDEGQDLPQGFFKYASYISDVITVFADEDQALNKNCSTLENIKAAANLPDPVILKKNHRNSSEIAKVAEHFHAGRLPTASVIRSTTGELPRLVRKEHLESTATLISNWYNTRNGNIGVIVSRNETGSRLQDLLRNKLSDKRVDIYRNDQKNEDDIDILSPGVTILNKESVKGQEFDTVFILELESFIPCETLADKRAMYMMCARARDNLFLIYGPGTLSIQAENALPGPHVLERS